MPRKTDRRTFIRDTGMSLAALALASHASGCDGGTSVPPPPQNGVEINGNRLRLDISHPDVAGLTASGGFFVFQSFGAIVINVGNDTYRAVSSVCTHDGCTVSQYNGTRMRCPCHGAEFTREGAVQKGPATRALPEFPVTRSGNVLEVAK